MWNNIQHRSEQSSLRSIAATVGVIFALFISAAIPPAEARKQGEDFIEDARYLFRALACGAGDLPKGIDRGAVDDHCRLLNAEISHYRKTFIEPASSFFAQELPKRLPRKVVIPFGGGDLLPVMTVYPEASEYTTISLESAGDPRRFKHLPSQRLKPALAAYRKAVGFLLTQYDISNEVVRDLERGPVPNQIAYSLTALAASGCEVQSLRFFRIENDGSIRYLEKEDIEALEGTRAQRLKRTWIDTDFSEAFRNMEMRFTRPDGRQCVHRHIAFNLDNNHFAESGLRRHIEGKGRIAAMIKGGSYLVWFDSFSALRECLLSHAECIVHDATGILPAHAAAAGFSQVPYGRFSKAFLPEGGGSGAASLRMLFASHPYRPLPFMFGYSDMRRSPHLIITTRKR